MSFGRDIRAIFGNDEMYAGLNAAPLASVELDGSKDRITFTLTNGDVIAFGVEGDCCSHSWIEHLDVPPDVIGETLTAVEDGGATPWDGHECVPKAADEDGYAYGNRNDSNGYYGGYLVRL